MRPHEPMGALTEKRGAEAKPPEVLKARHLRAIAVCAYATKAEAFV